MKREDLAPKCSDHALDAIRYCFMHTEAPEGPDYSDGPVNELQHLLANQLKKHEERQLDTEEIGDLLEYDPMAEPVYYE